MQTTFKSGCLTWFRYRLVNSPSLRVPGRMDIQTWRWYAKFTKVETFVCDPAQNSNDHPESPPKSPLLMRRQLPSPLLESSNLTSLDHKFRISQHRTKRPTWTTKVFFLGCDIRNITLWLNTSPLKKDQKLPSKASFICSYLRPTSYQEKVLLIVGGDEQISRNVGVSQNYLGAKKCWDVSFLQIVTIDSRALTLEFREMQSFDSYETTISPSQPPHFFRGVPSGSAGLVQALSQAIVRWWNIAFDQSPGISQAFQMENEMAAEARNGQSFYILLFQS